MQNRPTLSAFPKHGFRRFDGAIAEAMPRVGRSTALTCWDCESAPRADPTQDNYFNGLL
jgi:hypothetical protein